MSRICDLTGKKAISGNNVSFSQRKTKRRFNINLQQKRFFVEGEDKWIDLRLCTQAMRTINKLGLKNALKKYDEKGTLSVRAKKQLK